MDIHQVCILNVLASRQTYLMLQCIEESNSAVNEEGCQVKNGTVHTRQRKESVHYEICKTAAVATILGLVPILIAV